MVLAVILAFVGLLVTLVRRWQCNSYQVQLTRPATTGNIHCPVGEYNAFKRHPLSMAASLQKVDFDRLQGLR